ncbi:FG-GAP repeat domain-containing protein [Streptomyces sp. NPDC056169]|uniref:FG-GAP repeat domain-containing protein n=1 Tax=Streptomyces sp. NPDC056169 TaxID=3345734 RepID=UPI0035E08FCE
MKHHRRITRRHLSASVAVALAVTTGALTAPAVAAGQPAPPATAQEPADEQAPLDIPADSKLLSTGPTGMLTSTGRQADTSVYRWTPHRGGATVTLPAGPKWGSTGTDLVVSKSGDVYTLTDMSGESEPVVIDVSGLGTPGEPYHLRRVIGTTLLMSHYTNSRWTHHLVSVVDGRTVDRPVAEPIGRFDYGLHDAGPGRIVLSYVVSGAGSSTRRFCLVDATTGEVTENYEAGSGSEGVGSVARTANHLAWIAWGETPMLRGMLRGTQDVERIPLTTTGEASGVEVRPLGDWALYARPGGGTAYTGADPLHALTARSLTTGETFKVLDHVSSTAYDQDGNLLVLGGTLAQGEGLYRIAPAAATGKPAAILVRGSGRPTALVVEAETLPPDGTFDFDRAGGQLTAGMTLSRPNADMTLKLTHTASGRIAEPYIYWPGGDLSRPTATWNGRFGDGYPAYDGAYTWTLTATPSNGIGPAIERRGTFTLTRAPRPRDFDGNAAPDVLIREFGFLSSYDARQILGLGSWEDADETRIGRGWNAYDRITPTGDLGGTRHGDLVARDGAGVLWSYAGRADARAPFGTRVRIGGGWQAYDKLAGGSDLTGDGRNDLLATDKTGVLWLYPGTGSTTKPFATRKKIGSGWGVYNQLTATGNLAGGPVGDLVARDKAGVLWLYLGNGDGTFAPRTRIGGGWGAFKSVVGVGDADGDGHNDLLAHEDVVGQYPLFHIYPGTGQWKAPLGSRETSVPQYENWDGDVF